MAVSAEPVLANIVPTAEDGGILYANAVPLATTEAALGDGTNTLAIIPVVEGQTIIAVVKLTINGFITGNSTFIFLQTDLGDGTWVDVAWCFWNGTQGTATFILCGGGLGAMNNAFQQTRKSGSAPTPQANGSNAVPLCERVRITGFATRVGGSSIAAGSANILTASIRYKLQRPR